MLKNFFKISMRYLWRKRTYSILNYGCLTFGLSCSVIAMLYILNIFSFDRFHKNYERLYELESYVTYFNGDRFPKSVHSASLTDVLKENVPEMEQTVRIVEKEHLFENSDKPLRMSGYYADDNFFSVFTFSFLNGKRADKMEDPNSILISKKMAAIFFKTTDCIGKTLIIKDNGKDEAYNVTGIFNDVPQQSVLQFDFIIPFKKFLSENISALETGANISHIWVLLKENTDYRTVDNKIKNLISKQETTLNQELFLFPLREHILYSYAGGKRIWNQMQYVVIVGAIGLAILLISCFNFINLAIALNFRRYKEAGIKKIAGSGRMAIILQFLGETLIITIISLISSIILVRILLIGFNAMLSYDIQLHLTNIVMLAFLITVTIFTTLISGLLPAIYLASSDPVNILKGNLFSGNNYSSFRQGLIVFQFVIPLVLIICMMVLKTQDSYMRNYDAGIDQDNVIVINNTQGIQNHSDTFKSELYSIPGIEAVTFTNCIPTRGATVTNEVNWEGKDPTKKLDFWCVNTDFDYARTIRLKITEGRFFDPSFTTDSTSFVINDVAAGVMKNTKPLGTVISVNGEEGVIVGVIKDFHSIDLAGPYTPTIIRIKPDKCPTILIRFSSTTFQSVSEEIKKVYQQYENSTPFQATVFRNLPLYTNLNLPSRIIGIAFIIALLLACLGFFGLASFTSENRTKEVGIRKANGATTRSVMGLLLSGYAKWLSVSFAIAIPIAYIISTIFLGRFYFHTPMPIMAFLAGPVITFLVAFLTVSLQTWRVSNQNPVKALRYE